MAPKGNLVLATHNDSHLRKKPIQARSRRTVESILEAADRVLRNDGYDAASTNRIAQVAGYSVGSLYQYFADKESVVRTYLDQIADDEDAAVADELTRLLETRLDEAVRAAVERLLASRCGRPHAFRVLAERSEELYGVSGLERMLDLQTGFPSSLQQLAVKHWDSLRRDDPAAMLWTFLAGAQAITIGMAAEPQRDAGAEVLVPLLADAWTRALRGEPQHPVADELTEVWATEEAGRERSPARRLPAVRARLLRAGDAFDPARMAPVAFALACLPELLSVPAEARPGVADEGLQRELRIFSAALLQAGESTH